MSSTDGIQIRAMGVEDYPEVKIFMGGNFYNGEPLSASSGENVQKCYEQENDEYHISMIEQGTCLLAVDNNNDNKIVGLILAGAQIPSDLETHRKEAAELEQNAWGRIAVFLSNIELKVNLFEHYSVSKLLYLHIISVDASMRGKRVGSRLITALIEVGQVKKFPLLAAYCTSFYAARQMETMHMECVYAEAYADYTDSNGEKVFKVPAPHTHLRVMAMKL